jgi:lysophospholipase L1-like esterase
MPDHRADFLTSAVAAFCPFLLAFATLSAAGPAIGDPVQQITPSGFVLDGDSITDGYGVTPTYPTLLAAATGLGATNLGQSGRTLREMNETFDTRNVAQFHHATYRDTLVILGGINDIMNDEGTTTQSLQESLEAYCAQARAAGFRVIVVTLPGVAGLSAAKEAIRVGHNDWLRNNWRSLADALADAAMVPELSVPTDSRYFSDGLHLSPAGMEVLAETVQRAAGAPARPSQAIVEEDFDTHMAGWTVQAYDRNWEVSRRPALATRVGNRLRLSASDRHQYTHATLRLPGLVVGQVYRLELDVIALNRFGSAITVFETRSPDSARLAESMDIQAGLFTTTFTATGSTHFLQIKAGVERPGDFSDYDNLRIVPQRAAADGE